MIAVNVSGGTGAGSRRVKVRESWTCRCTRLTSYGGVRDVDQSPREHPGTSYSCGDCGERRPS